MRVRLLPGAPSDARSSEDRALLCDGRGRWFDSSRAYFADVAQWEAPERQSGEARSTRVVRFVNPWCNGSTTSSNLVGPGSNPGGFASARSSRAEAARPRPRRHSLLRAGTAPVIDSYIERSRVRVPPGALVAPVAQLVEHFRAVQPRLQQLHSGLHTTTAVDPSRLRAGVGRLSGRAPGSLPGGWRVRVAPGASGSVAQFGRAAAS